MLLLKIYPFFKYLIVNCLRQQILWLITKLFINWSEEVSNFIDKKKFSTNFQWKFCKLDKAANFKLSNQNSGYQ